MAKSSTRESVCGGASEDHATLHGRSEWQPKGTGNVAREGGMDARALCGDETADSFTFKARDA